MQQSVLLYMQQQQHKSSNVIGHLVPGELLSGCFQASAHSGVRSHHPAGHLEQPALHFLELIVVRYLFLHLAIQILHMSLDHIQIILITISLCNKPLWRHLPALSLCLTYFSLKILFKLLLSAFIKSNVQSIGEVKLLIDDILF